MKMIKVISQNRRQKYYSLRSYKACIYCLVIKCALNCLVVFLLLAQRMTSGNDAKSGDGTDDVTIIRGRRLKILIVDDDGNFRKSLGFKLRRKYGAEVEEAESGIAGIEKLQSDQIFDLIMLDIRMPVMNGVEAFHEMKKLKPDSYIVIMSAYSDSKEWNKAKQLQVPLLSKPISEETLTEILKEC